MVGDLIGRGTGSTDREGLGNGRDGVCSAEEFDGCKGE